MSREIFNKTQKIIALSPMDGVTDCAYREIVKKYSNVDILYTEFQNVHGMCLGVDNLFEHFRYTENQRFILGQIYGHEAEYFYPAAMLCFLLGFDGVDINMGCPAKKISDRGAGAGLIRFPDNAQHIISEVKRARVDYEEILENENNFDKSVLAEFLESKQPFQNEINSWQSLKIKWPKLLSIIESKVNEWEVNSILSKNKFNKLEHPLSVSVKTRIGYDSPTLENWILTILEMDIDLLAIHGRTLKQMYTGSADHIEISKGIKLAREKGYTLPILANGDIKTPEFAKEVLEITKADGVLVGRGSYGDPILIKNIRNIISLKELKVPTFQETKEMIYEHCKFFEEFKGENQFFQMRKNLGWYISGVDNAVELRKKLFLTNSRLDVENILK